MTTQPYTLDDLFDPTSLYSLGTPNFVTNPPSAQSAFDQGIGAQTIMGDTIVVRELELTSPQAQADGTTPGKVVDDEAGGILIQGFDAANSNIVNSDGGSVAMDGGPGSGSGSGGASSIGSGSGGNTGSGGPVVVQAGRGGSTSGAGGLLQLTAGDANAGDSNGGDIFITSGQKSGVGTDGLIWLRISGRNYAILNPGSVTANRTFTFPDKDGTFKLQGFDTMTYASPLALDTTLADLHKTTTVNATGSVTINASSGGSAGQVIRVMITNDATSGKTITFGTNFKPSATVVGTLNKTAVVEFVSDGSNFYETARTLGL